jgi:hypothetical protein
VTATERQDRLADAIVLLKAVREDLAPSNPVAGHLEMAVVAVEQAQDDLADQG